MLLDRLGYPHEDELVLVSVTKVNPNSVFCVLDHYGRKTGLIHISEISPGRIRNIRDYVVEGKKVVVKILKVDKEKGHIDLSLRRVTEIQKRNFNNAIKREQKAEKLLEKFAKLNKISQKQLQDLVDQVHKEYNYMYDFFTDIVEEDQKATEIIKVHGDELEAYVRDKIQPEEVSLKALFSLSFFSEDGVLLVQKALKKELSDDCSITYSGAGNYTIIVADKDYKSAEKKMKKHLSNIESFAQKKKGAFACDRE